jgi:hypothetical protein
VLARSVGSEKKHETREENSFADLSVMICEIRS